MTALSRRTFLETLAAGLAWPLVDAAPPSRRRQFRIRTVTAGIRLAHPADGAPFSRALGFLDHARREFVRHDFELQTVRIATQPLPEYLADWRSPTAIDAVRQLDERAVAGGVSLSIGPVLTRGEYDAAFAPWAARVIEATKNTSCSVVVASADRGVHVETARAAAEAIAAIADRTAGGEGNFRFAATALCPPGPFFPAAYHEGDAAFSIGLETPPLLQAVFENATSLADARDKLKIAMNQALAEIEGIARRIAAETGWRYRGIDTSPAPLTGASIGQAIETLTRAPFGEPRTLAACAAITEVLKDLDVTTCGYCGLMLPVLEDPVLARRAAEGRYGVSELLLYSSVCGTGLDVVPIPGDTPVADLAAVIVDVGTLAAKHRKALSARLFPVPGKKAGDAVSFENPFLTDSVVMPLG